MAPPLPPPRDRLPWRRRRRIPPWAAIMLAATLTLVFLNGLKAGPTVCREVEILQRLCGG